MKIIVGSKNPQKVRAVEELVNLYESLQHEGVEVLSIDVDSGISPQPITLDEIILGARNRAQNAFGSNDRAHLAFGIESGIMPVPHTKTGFMNICVCAIYDGNDFYIGTSGSFEPPTKIVNLMINDSMNMSEATLAMGFTENEYVGYAEGLAGILSKSKVNRFIYTKQAIQMALIRFENKHLY